MDELAAVLDRETMLLEVLVFRLQTLRQNLAGGDGRFLGWAAEEVEEAAARLREMELRRAITVAELAGEAGKPETEFTLAVLAEQAPEPYRTVFAAQRVTMTQLVAEVADGLDSTRRLARAGLGEVSEALRRVVGVEAPPEQPAGPYGSWASRVPAARMERSL